MCTSQDGEAKYWLEPSTRLADIDRVRVQSLLLLSLTPAFGAFICTGVETVAQSIDLAARVSSAFLVILLIAFSIYLVRSRATLPPDQQALISSPVFTFMLATTIINAGVQAVAAAGAFGRLSFSVIYFGLVVILVQGVLQFLRIIVARPKPEDA